MGIGLAVNVAYIHLNMLREQLVYGQFMFEEDNSDRWREQMEEKYIIYQRYLSEVYGEWQAWRRDQITTRCYVDHWPFGVCNGEVIDHITGEKVYYSENYCTVTDYFERENEFAKTYFFNQPRGEFMKELYQPSFDLIKFIPDKEEHLPYALPEDRELEFGPYNPYVLEYIHKGSLPKMTNRSKITIIMKKTQIKTLSQLTGIRL